MMTFVRYYRKDLVNGRPEALLDWTCVRHETIDGLHELAVKFAKSRPDAVAYQLFEGLPQQARPISFQHALR